MRDDTIDYTFRGLINATHVALNRGRTNRDNIDEVSDQVGSLRDDIDDLVSDAVANVISDYVSDELDSEWLSEKVTGELAGFGIDSYDWKNDVKSEILDAIADDDNDFSGQLDAHGNLITDVEDKTDTLSTSISEMESQVSSLDDELKLQEHRIGQLEAKLGDGPITSTGDGLVNAICKLYEIHGLPLDFDTYKQG